MHRLRLTAPFVALFLLASPTFAQPAACVPPIAPVPKVDIQKVRKAWLNWNNRLRKRMKLEPYRLDGFLSATASEWSSQAASKGTMDHRRSAASSYYDYKEIEQWFRGQGVEFANVRGTTFTENIGWGKYRCASGDCTRALIAAMRSTQRFYLAERMKAVKPHYASMMNDDFRQIGVGLALDEASRSYYLTIHYATKVTTEPRLCPAA